MRILHTLLVVATAGAFAGATAPAADPLPKPPSPLYETRDGTIRNGIGKFFMGREIAHVMGHQAAGWLERPEREEEERTDQMVDALKPQEGRSRGGHRLRHGLFRAAHRA